MKMTISDGKLQVDIVEFIDAISQLDRMHVIQALACHQEVIDEVVNQIVDGCTTEGWYGAKGQGGDPQSLFGLDGARMRIAKASSEIAAEEIAAAARRADAAEALGDEGWRRYHAMRDSFIDSPFRT